VKLRELAKGLEIQVHNIKKHIEDLQLQTNVE
jgi:predicted ArsR family transcriptional regulator